MSRIDELLQEHSLHSVRSDGSQMLVLQTGQTPDNVAWEVLFVSKDGQVNNDGTLTLPPGEGAVVRKTYTSEKLQEIAALQDFVEWRPGILEEHPEETALLLKEKLRETEQALQEVKARYEETQSRLQEEQKRRQELVTQNASQRGRERPTQPTDLAEIEQRIRTTASEIAERTPSHTQKIIANQVQLGAGFYQEVGRQSHDSFRLSKWLAIAGGAIFFLTAAAAVLVSLAHGDIRVITIAGTIATAVTEGVAGLNRLYNQASQQFANFQVYLDRINRSSICYAMVSEEGFEKKTKEQQSAIIKLIEELSKPV